MNMLNFLLLSDLFWENIISKSTDLNDKLWIKTNIRAEFQYFQHKFERVVIMICQYAGYIDHTLPIQGVQCNDPS